MRNGVLSALAASHIGFSKRLYSWSEETCWVWETVVLSEDLTIVKIIEIILTTPQ